MPRAVSIHIGVNQPRERSPGRKLGQSETTAWRMAGLAGQAGYHSIQVLRGPAATRHAVNGALAGAAGMLEYGDTLLVTFSGHGDHTRSHNFDERTGCDQSWCLHDGHLLDDQLAGYWRLFQPGVRIVVVSESCYSGGMGREAEEPPAWAGNGAAWGSAPDAGRRRMRGWRGPAPMDAAVANAIASCIAEPPRDRCEIGASVLMLTASSEEQKAEDGLFARHLLGVWNDGVFDGSYCSLYREVRSRVMSERSSQEPQILILGAADPEFGQQPAFRVQQQDGEPSATVRYRGF